VAHVLARLEVEPEGASGAVHLEIAAAARRCA